MELAFETRNLRAVCENEQAAIEAWGKPSADALKRRLSDLRAASAMSDIIVGRPRPMAGSDHNVVLDLCKSMQLVFCANHVKIPLDGNGKVDWMRVSRIRILRIETIHD